MEVTATMAGVTTGQLVRSAGLPDCAAQPRVGRLNRAGLLNRLQLQGPVGTAPHYCWPTASDARAIGAAQPKPWCQDPAGLRAVAARSELWRGSATVVPRRYSALRAGAGCHPASPGANSGTGTVRELPVEGELQVAVDGELIEQQGILELAASLATRCGDVYGKANDRTPELLNAAVFDRLDVKDGRLCPEQYRLPLEGVFTVSELE